MIIRLLSTTLAAAMASTMTGVSQEKAPQAAEVLSASAAAAVSLPVERTLTSTDGRTINVTILDKTATGIMAELNGKTLNIPLSTLSAADQAFIAGCKAAVLPSKKVLYVLEVAVLPADHANVELLKTAGYDVTFGYMRDNKLDRTDAFGKDTPESKNAANIHTAKGYGIYWFATPGKQGHDDQHPSGKWGFPSDGIGGDGRQMVGTLLKAGHTVIINSVGAKPYRWYIGTPDIPTYARPTPVYTKTEKNLITYNNQIPNSAELDPTIIPKVMKELQKSL